MRRAGAKLVLVGDPEQLRPIEAGAAFRAIVEDVGAARITEVRRQRTYWQQQATKYLADGKTADALQAYSDTGSIVSHEDRVTAIGAVVAAWAADVKRDPAKSTIMLSSTNANVAALNAQARRSMRENGKLGPEYKLEAWEESIDKPKREFRLAVAVGDRLMFTKNDNRIGVKNGTIGTLATIGNGQMGVILDGPNCKQVTVDLDKYRNFAHGYAATIHKAQGVTADRVHVMAGRNMDRNLTYVALSRHRDAVSLHFGKDDFASRSNFEAVLSRERGKDTTLDYYRSARERQVARTAEQARPLSVRDTFADSASKGSTSDRIREDMSRWRSSKGNRNRDFGREL